ncbi:PREDICTED: uncharacterized protein LOC108369171 [Rhagoletis zephyria]|uniref:uncharacterized protein LOC108369171 n=1 Tax=Rhagoletis zephyria TaxID=28612 RepID=UPI0008117FD0|nr:PREDICTED: uncharacterized protein LOC108369171 [Rhagoletis zephyria]
MNGVESKAGLKFTNAHCESFNKSWIVINECRLRAINRYVTVLNINITFLHPAYQIKLSSSFMKKANGYKPFVMDFTVDACDYIVKKNNAIANVVYSFFKNFSNINHTCPYYGDQLVRNFYPRSDLIKLVFPSGEYALLMNWFLGKVKTFVTNIYFTFHG